VGPRGLGPFAYDEQGRLKPGIKTPLILSFALEVGAVNRESLVSRSALFKAWVDLRIAAATKYPSALPADAWWALFKDAALALLERKTAAVPPPRLRDGRAAPLNECLATGILTLSADREGVKFFHESITDFLTAVGLVDSFQQVIAHADDADLVSALPLARVDLDFLQPSFYGFLHEQLGDAYPAALVNALSGRDISRWKAELVRNLLEYIGMTPRGDTDRPAVEWLLEVMRSHPVALVRYNAARALERVHVWAPRPYFDFMSDWGEQSWTEERRQAADKRLRPWAIRGFRMRDKKLVQRKPGQNPPLAVSKGAPKDDALHRQVSGELARLIRELLAKVSDEPGGPTTGERETEWLLINYSHAWTRWFHPDHRPQLAELRTLARGRPGVEETEENLRSWVDHDTLMRTFPFQWVGEAKWRDHPGRVAMLDINPEVVQPALSIQRAWHNGIGIVRGRQHQGTLLEDHIRERLDDQGRLTATAERIAGATDMRAHTWTTREHLSAHRAAYPDHHVVAWVGNGNLLSNPHFVGFDGSGDRPALLHLATEARHFGRHGRIYTCLVVRRPGHARRVTIEPLRFEYVDGLPEVYTVDGHRVTAEVECATYGQQLVRSGHVIDTNQLTDMITAGAFYDLRHVFLFGRISSGPDRWIDAGLSAFWDANGDLNTQAIQRALRGESVSADVRQFPDAAVREALDAKGYVRVPEPSAPGEYSLHEGMLRIVFVPGIYPHNLIGVCRDGRLISVAIQGLSNRVGVSITGAADIMRSLGAEDAILLDNGGDVMMSVHDAAVTVAHEEEPARLRAMLMFQTANGHTPARSDLSLTTYPAEKSSAETPPPATSAGAFT
jgi:hypothetical protein